MPDFHRGAASGPKVIEKHQVDYTGTPGAGGYTAGGYSVPGLKSTDTLSACLDYDTCGLAPVLIAAMYSSAGIAFVTVFNPTGAPIALSGKINITVAKFP